MPSTTSTVSPSVSLSSVVITPTSPTCSTARVMTSPIASSSLAANEAIRRRSSRPPIGTACSVRACRTTGTVRSMPRRSRIGLAPASTARSPSRTIAWASTVAVVVPSPTTPLVFIATSFTSWAPMFANGSASWISRAIVTPSLVMVGGPVSFSRTAFRPFGPSVTLTASASALTPCSSRALASVLYRSSLAMVSFLPIGSSGNQDGAAAHPARVEIVNRPLEFLQRVLAGVQLDLALCGEHHQLLQVVVGADQVADEVDLGGDDVDGGDVDVLSVSDDEVVPGAAQHGDTLFGRPALADEIEDGLGAVAAGEVQYLLHLAAVGDDALVRSDLDGQLHRRGIAVDDHDGYARNRLEHLDSDVPEATRADHDAELTRAGRARHLRGRVIGGQTGVGERGDVGGLERIVDLDHAAGGGAQILRVATVGVDPRELTVLEVHVVAGPAGPAQPAGDQRMQDHLVTHGDIGHRVADGVHPAGVLVAYRVRQCNAGLRLPLPFQDVKVGAAHPRAADLHDDVPRPFDGRLCYIGELQLGVVSDDLHGFHHGFLVLVLVNCITSCTPPPSSS